MSGQSKRRVRGVAWAVAAMLVCAAGAACTRSHASTTPQMPPLEVPAPPPRQVDVVEVEPAVATPPEEPVRAQPARPRPAAASRPAEARPEPGRAEATELPRAPEEPRVSPPALQTSPSVADLGVERAVRNAVARATADLNRVDYRTLDANARTQYDTAKRFIRQAEEAVRKRNLVFARNLADKAAALAAQLAGR